MNSNYRYILNKGSKKHHCPECTKKCFVRYIDSKTGEYLPQQYGRCDRENKCSYFLNPYKDGLAKAIWEQEQGHETDWKPQPLKPKKKQLNKSKTNFFPLEVFNYTLSGYKKNVFIQNLLNQVPFPFQVPYIETVISMYRLGTVQNGYRTGAITFPFIDKDNKIRTVQIKQFDQLNRTIGTDFLHSIIEKHYTRNNKPKPEWLKAYSKNEKKVSCLFGEHLLRKYPHNPVALVEAPKTAIYGTLYFGFPKEPRNLLWLAVFNLSSLNLDKCKVLQDRSVYLFPDLSKDGKAFESWNRKAKILEKQIQDTKFVVSDLLEINANETARLKGLDLADYLINQDWRKFRRETIKEEPISKIIPEISLQSEKGEKSESFERNILPLIENREKYDPEFDEFIKEIDSIRTKSQITEDWSYEITELEEFFDKMKKPTELIKLNNYSTITNISLFIRSHLQIVRANNGIPTFKPYLKRLYELQLILNK